MVAQWLVMQNLNEYIDSFMDKEVDGMELMELDTSKMKMLGIKSHKDREYLKMKIKELKAEDKRMRLMYIEQSLMTRPIKKFN
jgi:hypothetical protein